MWAKLLTLLVVNILNAALHIVIHFVLKYESWTLLSPREVSERAVLTLRLEVT